MPGKSVKVVVAAVVAAGALAGCGGQTRVGTAALVGGDRITVTSLDQTVRDWRGQFEDDPVANQIRANSTGLAPGLADEESETDMEGALSLLVNFRVADRVARDAGVPVPDGLTAQTAALMDQRGGAGSITLASGLPRSRARDLARFIATQTAVMQRFGADLSNARSPLTVQAAQQWGLKFQQAARDMHIKINPRFGRYDAAKVDIGPVVYELSTAETGTAEK
ncbi:hypothetical protein F8568_039310 [Actinomadura sp. LD22]|uniref:Lipoprotein n=1 Tax=Actinomadura physcomitrii TaxID=2650748 RepID=A0A6I4ML12_9ACTN|nr:hypothetical protein [Actinomadura physcomitrii]MWA06293.1 hypothetical protein [Actinomadura physcomitrii]